MNIERTNADGLVTYRLIDHGDGHGVEVHYDADGVESHRVDRYDLPIVAPVAAVIDLNDPLVVAAIALGMGLIERAPDLDAARALVAPSNTAGPVLAIINDVIQTTTPDLPPTA